jgi:hypothetical protein
MYLINGKLTSFFKLFETGILILLILLNGVAATVTRPRRTYASLKTLKN